MSTESSIRINTFCLSSMDFVGVYQDFDNALIQAVYTKEVLQGTEPLGDNTPTPLYVVDSSIFMEEFALQWKNGELFTLLREVGMSCEKGTNPNTLKNECLDKHILRRLNKMELRRFGKVVFASGSRKHGRVFAFNGDWNDLLGLKAISHGNNLVSNNKGKVHELQANILIVDDADTEAMIQYGLGDCHGIIKQHVADNLDRSLVKNPFQFRGFLSDTDHICKGVFRPVSPAHAVFNKMSDYDIVMPKSSFKYDSGLLGHPMSGNQTVLIAVHKPAKASNSSFGLNAQYFKADDSIFELQQLAYKATMQLNEYVKGGKLDTQAIGKAMGIDADIDEDIDDNLYNKVSKILVTDQVGALIGHPLLIRHVSDWFSEKVKTVALTAGIQQRYLLACPLNELEGMGNVIILNDRTITDKDSLLSRFPLRNRNDIQPTQIINLHEVWTTFERYIKENEVEIGDAAQAKYHEILRNYLATFNLELDFAEILFDTVVSMKLNYIKECFWVAPTYWSTFGGDFDGDYGNLVERSTIPNCYEEAIGWTRLEEAEKPAKVPMNGTINEQAVKSFSNDIGILSWMATIMCCTLPDDEYDAVAPEIAQQMQIAVDSFKTETSVDKEFMEEWGAYCAVHKEGHWIQTYKTSDIYTESHLILPETDDTIGHIITIVNQYFKAIDIKGQTLDGYKDLMPISYEHYHYHKPEWGHRLDEQGNPKKDKHGQPLKVVLFDKMGEFYGKYCAEIKDLSQYYENGAMRNYTKDEDDELIRLSDAEKRRIREQKANILSKYEKLWLEWMEPCTTTTQNILKAALWNVAHSGKATGEASLCFYLLYSDILANLSCQRTVSMKLVTTCPELLNPDALPKHRSMLIRVENEGGKSYNNPRNLYLVDDYLVGKIYPAPAKNTGKGLGKKVAMNFDRLVIEGEFFANFNFIQLNSKGAAEYEITVRINDSADSANIQVAPKQLELQTA